MIPRPWVAMKLIASGVTCCAAIDEVALVLAIGRVDDDDHAALADVRDRLLDRGKRPLPAELGIRVEILCSAAHEVAADRSRAPGNASFSTYLASTSASRLTRSPGPSAPSVVTAQRVRDQRDREARVVEAGDREPDPGDAHRALLDGVAHDLGRRREREVARVALGLDAGDLADAVDVALHPVAAHRVADAEGRLEVHAVACREPAERRPPQRLGDGVEHRGSGRPRAPTVRQQPSTATESPTRASAAIPGASTARSTPPPDGSHDRICPDSMTMPVKIYGS